MMLGRRAASAILQVRPGRSGVKNGNESLRNLPYQQHHVRWPHHRCHLDHRWPDLLPRRLARPRGRATQPRKVLLMTATNILASSTDSRNGAGTGGRITQPFDRQSSQAGAHRPIKLNLAIDPEPGHVRMPKGPIITFFIEVISPFEHLTWSIICLLTVIFASRLRCAAEGRGKAQADTLRKMRPETEARRLTQTGPRNCAHYTDEGRLGRLRGQQSHPSVGRRDWLRNFTPVSTSPPMGESAPVIRTVVHRSAGRCMWG